MSCYTGRLHTTDSSLDTKVRWEKHLPRTKLDLERCMRRIRRSYLRDF